MYPQPETPALGLRGPRGRDRPAPAHKVYPHPSPLPELSAPPPPITVSPIDFSTTPLPGYKGHYAVLLDNVLTAAECAALLALTGTHWAPSAVTTTRRDSSRVLLDAPAIASQLWDRIAPHLDPAVLTLGPDSAWPEITGAGHQNWSKARGETGFWRATGLNERLRFLRYTTGQKFLPHCDALYSIPGAHRGVHGEVRSFLTAHLYLSDATPGSGGATRFWKPAEEGGAKRQGFGGVAEGAEERGEWVDVEPRVGRVLVFQQRGLLHSGEPVGAVEEGREKYTVRTDVMYSRVVVTREERKREAAAKAAAKAAAEAGAAAGEK